MKKHLVFSRVIALVLCVMMVVGVMPITALAAIDYENRADDYYKLISKKDWELAPGVTESQIILDNAAGSHRQVSHVVEIDINNPYTKVIPSTYKMADGLQNKDYKVQIMSEQAKYAEEHGYGNVVAAMNLSLSWYDSDYYKSHPELVGEPLGYLVLDGEVYKNSQGQTAGAQTVLVINFDEKDGEARPDNIPKTEIRSTKDAITGWEEQVIPANFGFLVKDGKNQYSKNHTSDAASRSFVGIKADGTIVMVMNDGRQAPYSTGFNSYEMAEFMLSLGCVQAVNGDGGGSSAFLSQRPGEELTVNCSPSDGAERPTTHGILVISTAPATGEFVRATISAPDVYYTPGSSVQFSALGTDLVGTPADIPADVTWQLADPTMGTIENGLFVSSGKVGTATAQMVYNGAVVGEASVEIVIPEEFGFAQTVMTVPFDKEVTIGLIATVNGGLNNVVLKDSDVVFTTTNDALGTFNGLKFTSVSQENAPANLKSTLTATLAYGNMTATAALNLGKGSEVLFDFEDVTDLDEWKTGVVNGYHTSGFHAAISSATAQDGQVHNGTGSLRLETNGLSAVNVSAGGYAQVPIYLKDGVIVENALSIGFWVYIPDEYENCWIRVLYWYDSNNDGTYDKKNTITVLNQPEVYNTFDESGWRYYSVDVSAYSSILIPGVNDPDSLFPAANHPNKGKDKEPNDYRFIEFMFPHTNTNDLWKTSGSINGPFTIYIDNITADFSDAVDDREAPIFGKVTMPVNDLEVALEKYSPVTVTSNLLSVMTTVKENTAKTNATGLNIASAKAYVDGVEVDVAYNNGRMSISDVPVADGMHRVKFEIADNMGNKSVVIRLVNVQSGVDASTVQLVPADPTLDRLYGGSLYWMNLNATDIETIQSVKTVIDLNNTNHWELDHMVLADGFSAEYTIDEESNTATITVTRTGKNTQTGAATLAALPIRVLYYDTDIHIDGYTAETYWNSYDFWPYDVKVDVDMGEITYVDGYESAVLGAFSNEEFSVDTEMYVPSGSMDPAFKAERGTAHVHTPAAMADLAPTCTEIGYTGRTYCAVCDSIVDWGTDVPATGHDYKVVGDKLVCDCGEANTATGLVTAGGKTYYLASGTLTAGWLSIDDEWYYFDTTTYAAVPTYNNGYVTYEFEENGKLISGQWYHTSKGSRYYYGPTFFAGRTSAAMWLEIDGKKYCFPADGYCFTGIRWVDDNIDALYEWYDFGTDGALIGFADVEGLTEFEGKLYYVVNHLSADGLRKVGNDYYYFPSAGDYRAAVTNVTRYCAYTYCDLPAGTYTFGADGKMLNNVLYTVNNVLRYYEKGNVCGTVGSVEINGQSYAVDATGKVLYTGLYTDASGAIRYYENGVAGPLNGLVGDYYYINGEKAGSYYGLVEWQGNFYYVNEGGKIVRNMRKYVNKTNDLTFPNGDAVPRDYFYFDAEGKMIVKQGIADDTFYINGISVKPYYGLVEWQGSFYYVDAQGTNAKIVKSMRKYVRNTNGLTFADGTPISVGYYEFDAEGKMIVKQGFHDDQYYVNGMPLPAYYGLIEVDGYFYYLNDYGKPVKNMRKYVNKTNGLTFADGTAIPQGYFYFDGEGKMVIEPESEKLNGPVDGYFYKDGKTLGNYYGLVEWEGDFYYVDAWGKYIVGARKFVNKPNGLTFADGTAVPRDYFYFDADGKMIID